MEDHLVFYLHHIAVTEGPKEGSDHKCISEVL